LGGVDFLKLINKYLLCDERRTRGVRGRFAECSARDIKLEDPPGALVPYYLAGTKKGRKPRNLYVPSVNSVHLEKFLVHIHRLDKKYVELSEPSDIQEVPMHKGRALPVAFEGSSRSAARETSNSRTLLVRSSRTFLPPFTTCPDTPRRARV